jgi:hypothetical protein
MSQPRKTHALASLLPHGTQNARTGEQNTPPTQRDARTDGKTIAKVHKILARPAVTRARTAKSSPDLAKRNPGCAKPAHEREMPTLDASAND